MQKAYSPRAHRAARDTSKGMTTAPPLQDACRCILGTSQLTLFTDCVKKVRLCPGTQPALPSGRASRNAWTLTDRHSPSRQAVECCLHPGHVGNNVPTAPESLPPFRRTRTSIRSWVAVTRCRPEPGTSPPFISLQPGASRRRLAPGVLRKDFLLCL